MERHRRKWRDTVRNLKALRRIGGPGFLHAHLVELPIGPQDLDLGLHPSPVVPVVVTQTATQSEFAT